LICPYCQKEMEKGDIVGGHWYLHYVPNRESLPSSIVSKNPKGVRFKTSILKGMSYATAFRCTTCQKIIIDYKEEK
jgi:hypothetical protein